MFYMWTNIIFCYILTQCLISAPTSAGSGTNYCSPNFCNNSKQHTLCRFESQEPSSECIEFERTVNSQAQKEALLDKINSRRDKIASGDVRSFPPAEDMMKLEWSEELEKSAQRWAEQCVGESASGQEDICRDLEDISVGQSVASVYGEAPGLSPLSLVDVWYMELLNANSSVVPHYRPSILRRFPHYDYFTQLVWARSREVGCGSVKFKERLKSQGRERTVHRLVCNFAPSGNILGEPVYSEGPPCSGCLDGGSCDSTYSSLCGSTKSSGHTFTESGKMEETLILPDDTMSKEEIIVKQNPVDLSNGGDENSTVFDYFSEIYDFTKQPVATATAQSPNLCKDALGVDEFVELLKKKLTTDPMFKELLSTKHSLQNGNTDSPYTDPSVAAFVSKLYSKKIPRTTTKLPEPEYVNSTLLVDLVEAVIFRSADKTFSTEEPNVSTKSISDVTPVKIQAELAEVKLNQDFTGHYFFPEDSTEESVQETSDSYYDTSNLPVSDLIFEIESIKKDKPTPDFLEEIIDSDTGSDENKRRKRGCGIKEMPNENDVTYDYYETKQLRTQFYVPSCNYENNIIVKYSDLLHKLAADFKLLKLNERFHCSYLPNYARELKTTILSRLILCNTFLNYFFVK